MFYTGPVTAIHWESESELLFVAMGPILRGFRRGSPMVAWEHFANGVVFHGFASRPAGNPSVVAFGQRSLLMISTVPTTNVVARVDRLPDFAVSAVFSSGNSLVVGFAHDFVEWRSSESGSATERPRTQRPGSSGVVSAMSLHCRSGEVLVASAAMSGEIFLWSASTGQPLGILQGHSGPVHCVAFGEFDSGLTIASTSTDKTTRLWTSRDGISEFTPALALFGHVGRVWKCSLTRRHIVSASEDGTVRVWLRQDGSLRGVIGAGCGSDVWSVCCFQKRGEDCTCFACGGSDGAVKVFPIEATLASLSGGETLNLGMPPGSVASAVKVRLPYAAAITAGGSLMVWRIAPNHPSECRVVTRLPFHPTAIAMSRMSAPLLTVAVGGSDSVAIVAVAEDGTTSVRAERTTDGKVVEADFIISPARGHTVLLATSNWQGKVTVRDANDERLRTFGTFSPPARQAGHRVITCFAVSEESDVFVFGDECGTIFLVGMPDPAGGRTEFPLISMIPNAHGSSRVTAVVVWRRTPGEEILTTGRDGCFCRWQVVGRELVRTERRCCWQSMKQVEGVTAPDSRGGASVWGVLNNEIVVQSMDDSSCALAMQTIARKRNCFDLAFDCDESRIWVITTKGSVVSLSRPLHTSRVFAECMVQRGSHGLEINTTRFFPGGQSAVPQLLTGSRDGTIRIWSCEPRTMALEGLQEIVDHSSTVRCFSWCEHAGGRLLFSGGGNRELLCFSEVHGKHGSTGSFVAMCKPDAFSRAIGHFGTTPAEVCDDGNECRVTVVSFLSSKDGKSFIVAGTSDALLIVAGLGIEGTFEIVSRRQLDSIPLTVCRIDIGDSRFVVIGTASGFMEIFDCRDLSSPCPGTRVHSTGANSIAPSSCVLSSACPSCWLFSGGDDQALSATQIIAASAGLPVFGKAVRRDLADFSSITSISLARGVIFTCGISQLLRFWKFDSQAHSFSEIADPRLVDVADVSSTDVLPCGTDETIVAVSGQGLQVMKVL